MTPSPIPPAPPLPSLHALFPAPRYFELSPPQPVFTFEHPNWQQQVDNSRAISLTFDRPLEQGSGVLHGFAGYFESVLYKGRCLLRCIFNWNAYTVVVVYMGVVLLALAVNMQQLPPKPEDALLGFVFVSLERCSCCQL